MGETFTFLSTAWKLLQIHDMILETTNWLAVMDNRVLISIQGTWLGCVGFFVMDIWLFQTYFCMIFF